MSKRPVQCKRGERTTISISRDTLYKLQIAKAILRLPSYDEALIKMCKMVNK